MGGEQLWFVEEGAVFDIIVVRGAFTYGWLQGDPARGRYHPIDAAVVWRFF